MTDFKNEYCMHTATCGELRRSLLDSLSSDRYRADRRLWYEVFFAAIRALSRRSSL